MESPLAEQLLANNPWAFGKSPRGGGGMAGSRNLWAEAIAGAGIGERPQLGGFTAPQIQPGREMPVVPQNHQSIGGSAQSPTSVPGISGGGANPGSVGPGLEKLGEGALKGLQAYQANAKAAADAAARIDATTQHIDNLAAGGMPSADGSVPAAAAQASSAPPLFAQPGVSVAGGAGTGVTGGWPSLAEAQAYGEQYAAKLGMKPGTASAMIGKEYGGPGNPVGDKGTSFGPLQLHFGGQPGVPANLSKPGMGDDFLKQGIDARKPENWQASIRFGLEGAAKGGWGPWATSQHKLGWDNWTGINRNAVPGQPQPAQSMPADQSVAPRATGGAATSPLTAKDYDTAPQTPADWTGTRDQYIQSLGPRADNAPVASPAPFGFNGGGSNESAAANQLPTFAGGMDQSQMGANMPLALALAQSPDFLASLQSPSTMMGGLSGLFG